MGLLAFPLTSELKPIEQDVWSPVYSVHILRAVPLLDLRRERDSEAGGSDQSDG